MSNDRCKDPVTPKDVGIIREEGASTLKIQVWDADLFVHDLLYPKQSKRAGVHRGGPPVSKQGKRRRPELEAATPVATQNGEHDGEDNRDGGSDGCPIHRRGKRQGCAAFARRGVVLSAGLWREATVVGACREKRDSVSVGRGVRIVFEGALYSLHLSLLRSMYHRINVDDQQIHAPSSCLHTRYIMYVSGLEQVRTRLTQRGSTLK